MPTSPRSAAPLSQPQDDAFEDYATLSPASSQGDPDDDDAGATSANSLAPSLPPSAASTPQPLPLPRRGSTRKSTLTQQQKNNKRQRATAEQLLVLEQEFVINATPNAKTRCRIADQINMTERSVQIWFQNRRAKIKLLAKKGFDTGEDADMMLAGPMLQQPSAFFARPYGAHHGSRAALARSASFSNLGDRSFVMPNGGVGMLLAPSHEYTPFSMNQAAAAQMAAQVAAAQAAAAAQVIVPVPSPPSKTVVNKFSCTSLTIGTWTRVAATSMDLVVFYSPSQAKFTYYINNEALGFKIEYAFSTVTKIFIEGRESDKSEDEPLGDIVVSLTQPPQFFIESGGWVETDDFTEDRQASLVMEHRMSGPLKVLEQQLADLLCQRTSVGSASRSSSSSSSGSARSDSSVATSTTATASMMYPTFSTQLPMAMPFAAQWSGLTTKPVAMRQTQTHRRTRSRSVPAAVDFSYMTPAACDMAMEVSVPPPPPQPAVAALPHSRLRIDTTTLEPEMLDAYGYQSPAVIGTPLIGDMPDTPVTMTGDMVSLNPFTAGSLWVDNPDIYATPPYTVTSGSAGSSSSMMLLQEALTPGLGLESVLQTAFVKPDFAVESGEGEMMLLEDAGYMGLLPEPAQQTDMTS
ncbi:uncharacterized protein V1518DRAFT_414411 [Limtongia smithiae]|uniref:uncharacterized protein n=1 Tax=Limtongia smithiae TaxID=1125753 RepID=UPI0034CE92F4